MKALAEGGANLDMVVARRTPERPGEGVVFVAPVKGVRQSRAATQAGFTRAAGLHTVRAEGPDKPGLGARITEALAQAGVNLRGLSAAAIGKKCVVYLAVDTADAAARAAAVMKKIK
jgi:predicted amino acid-binding ACT domain protein